MKRTCILLRMLAVLAPLFYAAQSNAQLLKPKESHTRADSLRGKITPLRSCYDINYYHLDVRMDLDEKRVSGSNLFAFTATQDFNRLQFDLFPELKVEKVIYQDKELRFTREAAAVFVTFPKPIKKGSKDRFTVVYSGSPKIAKNAPWDGGFIYKTDKSGNPWASVACQGLGASVWWPNKDHQSDEVDSMLISIAVPKGLQEISNGRLRGITDLKNGYVQYNWFVGNPINNYNVTFYIGRYAHWQDSYEGEKGRLDLDFWSLAEDSTRARPHWDRDVKPMLKCFEHWFGPYPFYEDGYKLVQAPHLGMEHQSAVAYGNQFRNGYLGRDLSGTGHGLKFDFITVHESGHEWFGNNITARDIADMWIHESFTNYSETLFLECLESRETGSAYVQGIRKGIANDVPIIGPYDVNKEGSGDMYPKGANMIHTIRQLVADDEKFRQMLRGLGKTFYHRTVTTAEIENFMSKQSGIDLSKIFDQYLRHTKPPVLEYKIQNNQLSCRWSGVVAGFNMPVKVATDGNTFTWIKPTTDWKLVRASNPAKAGGVLVDPNFYVLTQEVR
ncbi:peptidase M1 [Pedobacter yulinensis]|uniref:Peptidase M1 n=1 Tax=Pedobacter yulinensis TaxID=2126353 RepID=A0A2T3HPN8_9SPHI|nr:M1 family metallopeptidase [Pedobacter yulinensis]PST84373.1 peptidase M1 [Pedobacter yulinensis]